MLPVRIETAEMGLPAIDALEVDSLVVFVGAERPLQGLAGYTDWRMCGLISRAIREETYRPEAGEALLLPSGGRLAVPRIFCLGIAAQPRDEDAFARQVRRLCTVLYKAGSQSWASALPELPAGVALPTAWLFLQALVAAAPRRLVLLGDSRSLQRDLGAAREALGAEDVEIVPNVSRVEMPPRAGGLPHPGAVVR